MLALSVLLCVTLPNRLATAVRSRDERGQATAEYALVMLAAAAIAMFVVSWVSRTDVIGGLLDTVFGGITGRAR